VCAFATEAVLLPSKCAIIVVKYNGVIVMQRISELLAQANTRFDRVEKVRREQKGAQQGLQEATEHRRQHDITYFEGLLKVLEEEQLYYLSLVQACVNAAEDEAQKLHTEGECGVLLCRCESSWDRGHAGIACAPCPCSQIGRGLQHLTNLKSSTESVNVSVSQPNMKWSVPTLHKDQVSCMGKHMCACTPLRALAPTLTVASLD
jgi:hypothetical protein